MNDLTSGVASPIDISMNNYYAYKDERYQRSVPTKIDIQNAIEADFSILNGATAA